MVAQPLPEPRRPAIVSSLADVRRRHRELRQEVAAKARLADEIRALQARAEREMSARRLYWQQFSSLPFR